MRRVRPHVRAACLTLGIALGVLGVSTVVVAQTSSAPPVATSQALPNAPIRIPDRIDARRLPDRYLPSRGLPLQPSSPLDPAQTTTVCTVSAPSFYARYDAISTSQAETRSSVVVSCRNVRTALHVVLEVPSSKRGLFLVGATPDDKLTYELTIAAGGVTDNGNLATVPLVLDPEPRGIVVRRVVLEMRIAPRQMMRAGSIYHSETPVRITY